MPGLTFHASFEQLPLYQQHLGPSHPIPEVLWHYTTGEGLAGIVQGGELHASEIRFMNDPNEVRHGSAAFKDALDRATHTQAESIGVRRLKTLFIPSTPNEPSSCAVACFCEKGDLLSQWRGYGQFGKGYAIGFDGRKVGAIVRDKSSHRGNFGPVVYDESVQRLLADEMLLEVKRIAEDKGLESGNDGAATLGLDFYLYLRCLVSTFFFKSSGFEEEKEWRGTCPMFPAFTDGGHPGPESNCKFRVRNGLIVPYYPIPLRDDQGNLPIREVMVGPGIEPSLADISVKWLFRVHNKGEVPIIRHSGLALR